MAWTPGNLANLLCWYRADLGVTGTSTVSAWADQSPNGNNLISNSGLRPSLNANAIHGKPAIQFNGSQVMYDATNFGVTGAKSFGLVFQATTLPGASSFYTLFSLTNSTNFISEVILLNLSGYQPYSILADYGTITNSVGATNALDTNPHGLLWLYTGGTNSSPGSYGGQLDDTNLPPVASGVFNRAFTNPTSVGARAASGGGLDTTPAGLVGTLAELFVTTDVMSSTELVNWNIYLYNRYNLGFNLLNDPIGFGIEA